MFVDKQSKLSNMEQQLIILCLLIACIHISHQVNMRLLSSSNKTIFLLSKHIIQKCDLFDKYIFYICIFYYKQVSTPKSDTYIAAVVEFPSVYNTEAELTLRANADAYIKNIKTANASVGIFVIIFTYAIINKPFHINYIEKNEMLEK